MKIATLVLAAGKSSRMGLPKQLLKLGSTTLLGKVIETVSSIPNNSIFCVLGANANTIKKTIEAYQVQIVNNYNYDQGLSSSIITGVEYISKFDFDAVLVVLGDQPKIESDYLKQMIEYTNKKDTSIIASKYKDRNGVPAIFPKKYFNTLLNLVGDKGASKILNNNEFPVITMNLQINLIDIDTKEDYQNLLNNI